MGVSKPFVSGSGVGGGGSGGSGGVGAASAGHPVAVPFRGKNMDKAKHKGRWVVFNKVRTKGRWVVFE